MGKIANKYLKVDPYKIIEEGFHKEEYQVSESLFNISNEYMGVRGYFDEIIPLTSLRGSYFNGVYDYGRDYQGTGYKGIVTRTHFMVNSVDYMKIRLTINGEVLNLNEIEFKDFYRELSLLNGLYTRKFSWILKTGEVVELTFLRFLSLTKCHNAFQKIILSSNKEVDVHLELIQDTDLKQWGGKTYFSRLNCGEYDSNYYSLIETEFTKQQVFSLMKIDSSIDGVYSKNETEVIVSYDFKLLGKTEFTRYVTNLISRECGSLNLEGWLRKAIQENDEIYSLGFDKLLKENERFFDEVYKNSDIKIIGNDEDQQGIRYCIYMLNTTYHGYSEHNNIGAKGLTGEAYSGHAFWDSETYCLPYYLFNNFDAAKNLILFRYNTLDEAKKRAKDLDCRGACYPIATLNGKEACTLWQHASLQLQPSTAVVYAIFHYYQLTHDDEFIYKYGYELLLEISKFLLDRGQYDATKEHFGFYGVMGPDEFKMMVNHNAYTNFMGKFTFEYLLKTRNRLDKVKAKEIENKCDVSEEFFSNVKEAKDKMLILYDEKSKVFEQNEGFFKLPHIDIKSIKKEEFPLYSHWTYDRIYRGDMIKQPDVLMFIFLFMSYFPKDVKKANYDYYEPRCIHESSLSPSIHSIFACDLGMKKEAIDFFGFASRLDLDNYNNNTCEGLHLTSIAAAWMNIVYGYGGLRSDSDIISICPTKPDRWEKYSFNLKIKDSTLKVSVDDKKVKLTVLGEPIKLKVYDQVVEVKDIYETCTY